MEKVREFADIRESQNRLKLISPAVSRIRLRRHKSPDRSHNIPMESLKLKILRKAL